MQSVMKASQGHRFDVRVARGLAEELLKAFGPVVNRMEIAGSIRRGCKDVHDVDLVVWPIYVPFVGEQLDLFEAVEPEPNYPLELVELVKEYADRTSDGIQMDPYKPGGKIIRFVRYGIPVELYLVEPDGSNFEALWQVKTGSAEFNTRLAMEAARYNKKYRAGYGVFDLDGHRLDDDTEAGIFKVIGISDWYLDPSTRVK